MNFIKLLFSACLFFITGIFAQAEEHLHLATFNIRYDNPDDGINSWNKRKDSFCLFLKSQKLDIFGLQEVLYNQLEDIKSQLTDYAEVGVGRDDGKTKGEYSPIFYDHHRFTLLKWNTFWLSETPDIPGKKGWDAACNRIATWAKLKDKKSEKVFFFVSAHLDNAGVTARKNSALLIQKEMKDIAGKAQVVLVGDFNSTPDDVAYRTMTAPESGFIDTRNISLKVIGEKWSFHDFGCRPLSQRPLLDFIFVKGGAKVLSHTTPFIEHNGHYLSDHNPVLVSLIL